MKQDWKKIIQSYDSRRDIAIPGNEEATLKYSATQFLQIGNEAITEKGAYFVALSGGSTPKALFKLLSTPTYKNEIDWKKVVLFWSDERSVHSTDQNSNYKMAMDSGFSSLSIQPYNIHRMHAEELDMDAAANSYEKLILEKIPNIAFDLVMLGMGEDGHTASLFPRTHALHTINRLVVANYIPKLSTWRMTLTFECINEAHHISIYILGKNKSAIVEKVFLGNQDFDELPIQKIGTQTHKALWIMDTEAASNIEKKINTLSI